jgi:hypothetical protein
VTEGIRRRSAAFDSRAIAVEATETLNDNIKLARDRKAFLLKQIEIAEDSIKDDRLKKDTIRELRDQRKQLTIDIEALIKQQGEAAAIKAQERRDQVTANLGSLLQIAELRGGKDAILAALDKAIADSRRRVAAAKKAGKGVLDERVALETLLAQKRDMLNDVEKEAKATGGTTAFSLLQLFAGRFGEVGGNLINGEQPFAGPTGFTADIAQFLKRQQGGGAAGATAGAGGKKSAFEINDDRIVRALDRVADALERNGGGDRDSGVPATGSMSISRRLAAAFYESRQSNAAIDAGGGV